MPSEHSSGEPEVRRLHPLSLLFSVGSAARKLLLPGIVVLAASRGSHFELWLMVLFIPAVVAAAVKYLTYRYRFEGDELIIREGIVTRNERHVPYARIQNVDLEQNPLHRLFRVAEVRLETAGGSEPEAVIRVLSLDAVARLRSRVFAGRRQGAATPETVGTPAIAATSPARLLHHLTTHDVLLYGIISNKGMIVVAAMMGLVWQFDVTDQWRDWFSPATLEWLGSLRPQDDWLLAALVVPVLLIVFLLVVRLLSVVWAFLKFHGFRLSRRADDLRAEYGLLTRVSKTIPRQRIQKISTRTTPLHRWFSRASIQIETAGGAEGQDGSSTNRLWLAPLIVADDAPALLREVLPEILPDDVEWQPISDRAWLRLLRRSLFFLVPLTTAAVWGLGWAALIPGAMLAGLACLNARLYARHAAYALTSGAIFYRSGWWVRTMSVARFGKIQSLELVDSPFDRRNAMASLRVDTAGAKRIGHGIHIAFLDAPVAARLLDRLSLEAASTVFRW